jgi:uncharacterized protein
MAAIAPIADASFLVSLLDKREGYHQWATAVAARFAPPWRVCEAVISEAFFLLGPHGRHLLMELLGRDVLKLTFSFQQEQEPVLALMRKYADVPMSLADACIVRMTEVLPNPIVLTADGDFKVYRRHGRRVVPMAMPD